MRYGKSAAQEIDPTVRQQPGQKPKSAAPGAPFGWTKDGLPYIGTQYCVRKTDAKGWEFCSLSTRDGSKRFFWKPLTGPKGITSRVALSALETHGSVGSLRAGESEQTLSVIFEPEALAHVRKVFAHLVGEDTLRAMEGAGADDDEPADAKPALKAKTPAAGEGSSSGACAEEADESKVVGKKRLARMEAVDVIKKSSKVVD